jgi:hypothetical protein
LHGRNEAKLTEAAKQLGGAPAYLADLSSGSAVEALADAVCENPDELVNQFDNPDYAELKAELMAMIKSRPEDRREIQKQVGMA